VPAPSAIAAVAATAAIIAGIDQLTKVVIVGAIGPGSANSRIALSGDWVALDYAENRGAAFGLFSTLTPVLIALSAAILVGVLIYFFRMPHPARAEVISVGAIAGGALGNLVDRVRLGYVVDFVAVGPWPNFNVADSAITLGVLGLIWGWVRTEVGDSRSPERL
jgi:signal peptidase II